MTAWVIKDTKGYLSTDGKYTWEIRDAIIFTSKKRAKKNIKYYWNDPSDHNEVPVKVLLKPVREIK